MNRNATQFIFNWKDALGALKKHKKLWIASTVACAAMGTFYAVFLHSPKWHATQSLLVRDEAMGGMNRGGRFDSVEAMKNAQETIQEIARKHNVVAAALSEVGPESNWASKSWPHPSDIEDLQGDISVSAPNGAEFGKTEVIHLTVAAGTKQRAIDLTQATGNALEARLKEIRVDKSGSVIVELENTLELAKKELEDTTARISKVEGEVGADLGELRILNDVGAGESNLRQSLTQIKNELRQAKSVHNVQLQQRTLIKEARKNPESFVATPNQLLETQPSLRRLKDGLVDAQLRRASLVGKMNPRHPSVLAAQEAEAQVRARLYDELELALLGLNAELAISENQVTNLERQLGEVQTRLDTLAKLRAGYGNLVAELKQRSQIVETARQDLANAKASQEAALSASLITRLDDPQTGLNPSGIGRTQIVLISTIGGFLIGIGLVFFKAPFSRIRGRRWSDYLPGRRESDRNRAGRRGQDRQPSMPATVAHATGQGADLRGDNAWPAQQPAASTGNERRRGNEKPLPPTDDQPAATEAPQTGGKRASDNTTRRASDAPSLIAPVEPPSTNWRPVASPIEQSGSNSQA